MKINTANANPSFSGKVILNNKISTAQNYLLNRYKNNLDNMIKDMPFDLLVKQSKSKKTISLTTNVDGALSYQVKKNEQDFIKAAGYAIEDGKQKSKEYKTLVKVNYIFDNKKRLFIDILSGNFKEARKLEKTIAKDMVENFEIMKTMPKINFLNVPPAMFKTVIVNSLKYKFYKMFSTETPEEKLLKKMQKKYLKEIKKENKQIKTVNIELPKLY